MHACNTIMNTRQPHHIIRQGSYQQSDQTKLNVYVTAALSAHKAVTASPGASLRGRGADTLRVIAFLADKLCNALFPPPVKQLVSRTTHTWSHSAKK